MATLPTSNRHVTQYPNCRDEAKRRNPPYSKLAVQSLAAYRGPADYADLRIIIGQQKGQNSLDLARYWVNYPMETRLRSVA